MENNCSSFNEKLKLLLAFRYGILIFVTLVLLGIMIYSLKIKFKKAALNAVLAWLVLVVLIFVNIIPYHIDIKRNAYIIYEGKFYVEECYSSNRSGTYILIKTENDKKPKRYRMMCDINNISNDTSYIGKFAYSKKTKVIVDIEWLDIG